MWAAWVLVFKDVSRRPKIVSTSVRPKSAWVILYGCLYSYTALQLHVN